MRKKFTCKERLQCQPCFYKCCGWKTQYGSLNFTYGTDDSVWSKTVGSLSSGVGPRDFSVFLDIANGDDFNAFVGIILERGCTRKLISPLATSIPVTKEVPMGETECVLALADSTHHIKGIFRVVAYIFFVAVLFPFTSILSLVLAYLVLKGVKDVLPVFFTRCSLCARLCTTGSVKVILTNRRIGQYEYTTSANHEQHTYDFVPLTSIRKTSRFHERVLECLCLWCLSGISINGNSYNLIGPKEDTENIFTMLSHVDGVASMPQGDVTFDGDVPSDITLQEGESLLAVCEYANGSKFSGLIYFVVFGVVESVALIPFSGALSLVFGPLLAIATIYGYFKSSEAFRAKWAHGKLIVTTHKMAVVRLALYLGWVTMEHSVANTYYDGPASVQLWHDSRCCKKPLTHITLSTLKDESFAMGDAYTYQLLSLSMLAKKGAGNWV
jgi:hypothetical protein